jgi:hypothetical protein
MSKEKSNRYIRNLASMAARLSVEDWHIPSFSEHEKTIVDNMEFLYWMVELAKLDEREACAKVCDELAYHVDGSDCARAIRAGGK